MKNARLKAGTMLTLVLFALYLMLLLKLTVFRGSNTGAHGINLIPFVTISEYLQYMADGNRKIGVINILGNLMIFLPLGYMTALLFPSMRKLHKILVLSIAFSLSIEFFQFVFACGSTDIDDVILNTLGGMIGFLAMRIRLRLN
jgi:glycopeptide antibiotics resistance protein